MYTKIFELNMNNTKKDTDVLINTKLRKNSPIVEIFSAITKGEDVSSYGKKVDLAVDKVKELGQRAMNGDATAKAELNTIQRYSLEPHLQKLVQLFSFMGTFKDIGYDVQPMVKTYRHESIRSNFQASHGDVPFGVTTWEEYPISTQTISSGYAVDYREVASGNLDKISEGIEQTKIDMMNKAMYYAIFKLYDGIKNATGVKFFAETSGIIKEAVDHVLTKVRRFGKPAILGDYSVVSQLNNSDFDVRSSIVSEAVLEEIRKSGLLSFYNGSPVVELPNQYNLAKLTTGSGVNIGDSNTVMKKEFETYLPEGLLFFVPQSQVAPFQIFRRGGLTSMTGQDIVTGTELTRFDMEIGADLAKGREYEIGLLSDSNFEVPAIK